MQHRTAIRRLFEGVLLAALLVAAGCSSEPAEERLRARIDSMQKAVEERDARAFADGVAEDFAGNNGMDRDSLRNLLRVQLLRNAVLGATRGPTTIELQGDRATVRFQLVLTGGAAQRLPDRARAYSITSGWREESGEWRVFHADWQPVFE